MVFHVSDLDICRIVKVIANLDMSFRKLERHVYKHLFFKVFIVGTHWKGTHLLVCK